MVICGRGCVARFAGCHVKHRHRPPGHPDDNRGEEAGAVPVGASITDGGWDRVWGHVANQSRFSCMPCEVCPWRLPIRFRFIWLAKSGVRVRGSLKRFRA
eukprot:1179100-Prorocentrum_minimum.AAC.2